MSTPASNASTPTTGLSCSISGQTIPIPNDEAVVTKSGHVCSKRLLLQKLAENDNRDPFQPSRTLDETELITLQVGVGGGDGGGDGGAITTPPPPPRPASATSIPSLLNHIQSEHDALLLELYDARTALEQTRMELSSALYQNDAAVRVIARVCMERDAAREQLAALSATARTQPQPQPQPQPLEVEREEPAPAKIAPEEPAAKKPRVEEDATAAPGMIPQADRSAMLSKWEELSTHRKKSKKSKSAATAGVSPEQLATYVLRESKNLHKSNKPGTTCLAIVKVGEGGSEGDVVATGGVDRSIVLYSTAERKIVCTISDSPPVEITNVDLCKTDDDKLLVAAATKKNDVRVYVVNLSDNGEYEALGSVVPVAEEEEEEQQQIVGVSIHPTSRYVLATGRSGKIIFCKVEKNGVEKVAVLQQQQQQDGEDTATASTLHPDGLIVAVGTSAGQLHLWDLKEQRLASTLKGHNGPVTSINFSENGYHIASTSASGEVLIWDLRKSKTITTLNAKPVEDNEGEDEWYVGATHSVAFDPSGKYLAYGGEKGTRVTVVKEWGKTASFPAHNKKKGHKTSSVVWGSNGSYVATGCSNDRALKFWGAPAVDGDDDDEAAAAEQEEGGK